uniref:Uncharacterized protein n=1 Tax=Zea mays TaxID=4577 RepID=C4J053_MAIZE|nr:unknown [Zea mays]
MHPSISIRGITSWASGAARRCTTRPCGCPCRASCRRSTAAS